MAGEDAAFERLAQRAVPGSRLLRHWTLTGGISAVVTALEIERADGERQRLVVRQHGAADRAKNPQIARDEFRLLEILQAAGVPVPAPIYVEASGEVFETPAIVVAFVEGSTDAAPSDIDDLTEQLAAQLARIHRVDGAVHDLSFLSDKDARMRRGLERRPERLDESIREGEIRDALEAAVRRLPRRSPPTLLHGDYWPGNILWRDGVVEAVIDWEDAALGDPLADVSITRLEMLWAHGREAMDAFTLAYHKQMPLEMAHLPFWDLCAALRPAFELGEWAADAAAEQRMRERLGWFVEQGLAALASE
jgi:aminoglycoside phosphotransferase (APT) family kinase protein